MTFTVALIFSAVDAQAIEGPAYVTDGDTIEIAGQRIRLWGIDAIEGKQLCKSSEGSTFRCGENATSALRDLIGRRPVACNEVDFDRRNKRPVAVCSVGGIEINEWLVRQGWAIDYVDYSEGAYAAAQNAARAGRLGNWVHEWQLPANFRRCMKAGGGSVARCSAQR